MQEHDDVELVLDRQLVADLLIAAVAEVAGIADDRQRQVRERLLVPETYEIGGVLAGVVADEDLRDPRPEVGRHAIEHAGQGCDRVVSDDEDADPRCVVCSCFSSVDRQAASIAVAISSSGAMQKLPTKLDGPMLLAPVVHGDERGFFLECYRRNVYEELGIDDLVQDNHSRSRRGIVRGMHFQPGQAKLVRCVRGAILDVIVDIRRGSPQFGVWEAFALDDLHHHQLYIPDGFAHGFCVLSELADVTYKTSAYYDTFAGGRVRIRRSRGRDRVARRRRARRLRPRSARPDTGGTRVHAPVRVPRACVTGSP